MNATSPNNDRAQRRYTNAALTVITGLLAMNALNQAGVSPVSTAYAQQGGGEEGMVSAAEQRKVMISELRQLSGRMERMESALTRGINVKVLDMPPVRLADGHAQSEQPKNSRK